jgi:hypothetical protein
VSPGSVTPDRHHKGHQRKDSKASGRWRNTIRPGQPGRHGGRPLHSIRRRPPSGRPGVGKSQRRVRVLLPFAQLRPCTLEVPPGGSACEKLQTEYNDS